MGAGGGVWTFGGAESLCSGWGHHSPANECFVEMVIPWNRGGGARPGSTLPASGGRRLSCGRRFTHAH